MVNKIEKEIIESWHYWLNEMYESEKDQKVNSRQEYMARASAVVCLGRRITNLKFPNWSELRELGWEF